MSYKALALIGILAAVGVVSALVKGQEATPASPAARADGSAEGSEPRPLRSVLKGPGAPAVNRTQAPAERGALGERLLPGLPVVPPDGSPGQPGLGSESLVPGPVLSDPAGQEGEEPSAEARSPVGRSATSNANGGASGPGSPLVSPGQGALPAAVSARRVAAHPRAGAESSRGVLSASSAPVLRSQTQGPKAVVVGKETQYKVTVVNEGSVEAEGVHVRVMLPASVQVIRAESKSGPVRPQNDGAGQQHLVWSAGRIPAGGEESIELTLKPTDRHPFEFVVDWTLRPASATAQIEVQQPELALALFGPKDILYGKTAVFTIQLTNPGTGDAEDVVLNFLYGQQRLDPKTVGRVAAGEQKEIDVELSAAESGLLQVAAVATAAGELRAEATQQVLVRRGRLEVEIQGPAIEFAGAPTSYRLRVANTGDAAVSDVTASVLLPQTAKPMAAGEPAGLSGTELSWKIGSLTPGAERVIDWQCEFTAAGASRLEARVRGSESLEAAREFVTQVKALADLKLLVNDPPGPTAVGQDAIYEVRIINRGTQAAEQVHVIAQFSEGIEPVEAQGGSANLVPGQVLFRPISRVEPGEEVALKVIARATRDGMHRFRAQVTCADPETRLAAEESSYFFGSEIPRTARRTRE